MSGLLSKTKDFEQISKSNRTIILILLCLAYLLDFADRMVMSSLFPLIKADWHVSDTQLGLLNSVVALFIALFVFPLSLLIDRWSRKKMVAIMVFGWSVATLVSAFATDYNHLLLLRAFTGLGEAGYGPAAVAMIAALYPIEDRAKYIGIWDAFAPLGAAIGFMVGGIVGLHFGWRHAMGLLAFPGIILSLFFWFSADYKTIPLTNDPEKIKRFSMFAGLKDAIPKMLKTKTLWFVFIAYAMNFAIGSSLLTWVPSYLNRFYGYDENLSGKIAGLIAMLALVGAPLGGFLADYWYKKNKNARMLVASFASLITIAVLFYALLFKGTTIGILLLIASGVFVVAFIAPATAVIQDVVHPGVHAMAFGMSVVFMNIFGAFWAPIAIGKLSDLYGLDQALYMLPVLGVISTILFFVGTFHYKRDLENVSQLH